MIDRVSIDKIAVGKKYVLRYIRTGRTIDVIAISTDYRGKYAVKDKDGYPRRCICLKHAKDEFVCDYNPVDTYGDRWELLEKKKEGKMK